MRTANIFSSNLISNAYKLTYLIIFILSAYRKIYYLPEVPQQAYLVFAVPAGFNFSTTKRSSVSPWSNFTSDNSILVL